MPPATRIKVFKQRVAVALRPAFVAAAALLALAPQTAGAVPVASFTFSPAAPFTNEPVTFVSTSSGATTAPRWDLDGDRLCDDATGPSASRSFWPSGPYAVTLCVSDGTDDATVTRRFTVQNRPPAAAIAFAPLFPLSGDSITLASTSADPDGPIVSLDWDLDGDGAFDDWQGPTASVVFADPGGHRIGLLATDRDGAANATAVEITVRERPPLSISPFPVVRIVGSFGERGIRVAQLVVTAPEGARVEIRCRGRGCPFRKLVRKPGTQTVRVRRFARRVLRPGAVVQVWVTRPGEIGKYTRFRIRKGRQPTRVDRCLAPGSMRPAPCGS
jgi:PKD repeat protein